MRTTTSATTRRSGRWQARARDQRAGVRPRPPECGPDADEPRAITLDEPSTERVRRRTATTRSGHHADEPRRDLQDTAKACAPRDQRAGVRPRPPEVANTLTNLGAAYGDSRRLRHATRHAGARARDQGAGVRPRPPEVAPRWGTSDAYYALKTTPKARRRQGRRGRARALQIFEGQRGPGHPHAEGGGEEEVALMDPRAIDGDREGPPDRRPCTCARCGITQNTLEVLVSRKTSRPPRPTSRP